MEINRWLKATKSAQNGACVEVMQEAGGNVLVRDSKNPNGATLTFTAVEWDAFLDGVDNNEFDL